MKTKILPIVTLMAAMAIAQTGIAQTSWSEAFNKFKLEARADFNMTYDDDEVLYGFQGRYFNLHLGGNLGNGFSYYFRQRLKAEPGSIDFFDNTDFLYLNYRLDKNWQFRFGKDAMAVGGYEYDAPPIDIMFEGVYWDNFYCFQLATGASYTTDDGNHTFTAQVSASPFINSFGYDYSEGLLSYNFLWTGHMGDLHTLWSTSMMERKRGAFMNYTALGTKFVRDDWDIYVDLIHHAVEADDWGKNFAIISRFNYRLNKSLQFFVKGTYEQNESQADLEIYSPLDCLIRAGHAYTRLGGGVEYRPKGMESVRLHAFVALMGDRRHQLGVNGYVTDRSLYANVGATWTIDFHKMFNKN